MKEMQDMIHLDPESIEIISVLRMKGFELMNDNDIFLDTNKGVVLSYERTFFFNRNDKKSIIMIGKSKNGLSCNLLQMKLFVSECSNSMKDTLFKNHYTMHGDNRTFHRYDLLSNKGGFYKFIFSSLKRREPLQLRPQTCQF